MSVFIIDKPLPGLDRQQTARLVSYFSDITCGENCWSAKEDICHCSCGGKNHGIDLRGENALRNCKIGGYRYELVSVGTYRDLLGETEALIRDGWLKSGDARMIDGKIHLKGYTGRWFASNHVHPTEYNSAGGRTYQLKRATLPQCLKWQELEYLKVADDRDRYHIEPAILWKRADIQKPE